MRHILFFLISLVFLTGSPCFADEALLVQIVAVDREKGEMRVQVLNRAGAEPAVEELTVTFSADDATGSLNTGDTMRVWGQRLADRPDAFQARAVRRAYGRGVDPTGVRSRFNQSHGRGMRGGSGGGSAGRNRGSR